jgi:hypothetical protein
VGISRRQFALLAGGGIANRLFSVPPRPKLLVLVLLEQVRGDCLDDAAPQFSPGGLKRILEKGAWFPDCRHLASTFPASTIATLTTGAWPAQHGIVAGSWYDRAARRAVPASDEALVATTLTAQIVAEQQARAFVVALDALPSRLFAGTSSAQRYWMDDNGSFVTLGEAPDWLATYNAQRPLESLHDAKWQVVGAKPDAPALRVLTYSPDHPRDFLSLYRASPFAQKAQFDFASELITHERLGLSGSFDFLCLILGSTALLAYETGANSPLMQQMILNLDRQLEALLAQLSKVVGDAGFNLVFVGAHGAPPHPGDERRARMAVNGESVAEAVERVLSGAAMGHVEKYVYPFLYLDTSGFRDPEPVRLAAARAAMQYPAVAGYYTAGGACSVRNGWERRFRNSFYPGRSGDVMVSYRPEYIEEYARGRGVSFGSLYNYDVQVPLCFYGPQFRAGVFENTVESVDLAPTLARAIGVGLPSSATGRVLGEAFAA